MASDQHRAYGQLKRIIAVTILTFAAAASAIAQDTNEFGPGRADKSSVGYYYDTDQKGHISFTQLLCWNTDPYALRFEVTIRNADGKDILHEFTAGNSLELKLAPGAYSYNIVTWNLLDKPEVESGFLPLHILKAEKPKLTGTSPSSVYTDSLNEKITLKGEKLVSGARYFLRNSDIEGSEVEGSEVSRSGNEKEVVIKFPDWAYKPGTYDIVIVNPGGISTAENKALRVDYKRPLVVLVSLGYAPVSFVTDSWFKENWTKPVYWAGASGALSVYFMKVASGLFGTEAAFSFHRLTGGTDDAKLTSDYYLGGANLLYKYRYLSNLHFVARAGGGLSFSKHSFDYDGEAGPKTNSTDPYLNAGVMVQYFLPHNVFAEFGIDWVSIFEKDHAIGGIEPALRVGYQIR